MTSEQPVHHRLDGLDGVDFGDDDLRAQPLCAHRHALAAPAVAGDDDGLARHDEVGCAVDAVPDRLPGAVAVVEQVLAVGVVDEDHREAQSPFGCHRLQTDDAGCRLFAAAEDVLQFIGHFLVQRADEVAAVVDDDVAVIGKNGADVGLIFGFGAAVSGEHLQPALYKRGGHVILRGEGVGAGDVPSLFSAHPTARGRRL